MSNTLSSPIKVAAGLFMIAGLINLIVTFTNLTSSPSSIEPESLQATANELTQIINIISAVIGILIGCFLLKAKHWAYTLGLILVSLGLVTHLLDLSQVGTTVWYRLILSAAILISLIVGRNDFKKG